MIKKIFSKLRRKWVIVSLVTVIVVLTVWQIISGILVRQLMTDYEAQRSAILYDRQGKVIQISQNQRGYYDQFVTAPPSRLKDLLLKKEDRFFYFHPGFNPVSWVRDIYAWLTTGKRIGSSTLSQQLVKTLLSNESKRTWYNKLREFVFTESLEWHTSKQEILTMYLNSAYFGGLSQGVTEASAHYFNSSPENLTDAQILALISSLNNPSSAQPTSDENIKRAKALAQHFKLNISEESWQSLVLFKDDKTRRQTGASFELNTLNLQCQKDCRLTVDADLTQSIRDIIKRDLTLSALETARNGAVIVIKLPENEILSIVGSPDPSSSVEGMQLNMATRPRAIGSTAKPFIYLNAFEKGARPYSLVDDTEIKYQLGTGFDFFPKNFDGQYRGIVTLHQALDNSLNIPSVQVLSFVGLKNFYKFLLDDLKFKPTQPLENYELAIALGGLEVDPLTLSYYFSLFPQQGYLKPLTLYKSGFTGNQYYEPPMAQGLNSSKLVGKEPDIELVNRILNDRETGVDQFGLKSNLNLPFTNYALKTGTSRDYHDSWTVGYTPDFLVGVWVGNADNSAMREVTGLSGAARVWREVMQLMYNSPYNKNTAFKFDKVQEIQSGNTLDFGLAGDDYNAARQIMLRANLILSPHDGDKYLMIGTPTIPFAASVDVDWSVNGKLLSHAQKLSWPVPASGTYTVSAITSDGKKEQVTVYVNKE